MRFNRVIPPHLLTVGALNLKILDGFGFWPVG